MKPTLVRWIPRLARIAFVALLIIGAAKPISAMPCFTDIGNCWVSAANVPSFWFRWAAGLDCELGFISCARFDLIGR